MNKYLEYIYTLCFCAIVFKSSIPEVLNQDYVQLPALLIFGILAPIGFAISLRTYFSTNKSKLLVQPLCYLLIYLMILGSILMVTTGISSMFFLSKQVELSKSQNLFNLPTEGRNQEIRMFGAKHIYIEYGGKVAYKLDSGLYKIYVPDKEDIAAFKENLAMTSESKQLSITARNIAHRGMLTSIYLICSFILLFSITMFIQQKKASKLHINRNAT